MVKLAAALALALSLVTVGAAHALSGYALVDQAITDYHLGQWRARVHSIAECESKYDPAAWNRRSDAVGTFQFIPSTARNVGINPWDEYQNVYAAVGMMAEGAWSHWYACDPWQWRRR